MSIVEDLIIKMALRKEVKTKIIKSFKQSENDNGSSVVQVALLTERINNLTSHLKSHAKDFHSRRGLLHLVNQRRKLMLYLKNRNEKLYLDTAKKLKLKA